MIDERHCLTSIYETNVTKYIDGDDHHHYIKEYRVP
jgi:hypothetical protein